MPVPARGPGLGRPGQRRPDHRADLGCQESLVVAGVDHEVGLPPLAPVGHLLGPDLRQLRRRSCPGGAARAGAAAVALAETTATASTRPSPPVSNSSGMSSTTRGRGAAGAAQEPALAGADQRVDDRLESPQLAGSLRTMRPSTPRSIATAQAETAREGRGDLRPPLHRPARTARAPRHRHRTPARRRRGTSSAARLLPMAIEPVSADEDHGVEHTLVAQELQQRQQRQAQDRRSSRPRRGRSAVRPGPRARRRRR